MELEHYKFSQGPTDSEVTLSVLPFVPFLPPEGHDPVPFLPSTQST